MFVRWGKIRPFNIPKERNTAMALHHPPILGGIFAFIIGFVDSMIIPTSSLEEGLRRSIRPDDRINIDDGSLEGATHINWTQIKTCWCRILPDGNATPDDEWHPYKNEDTLINAICLRGDKIIKENPKSVVSFWPWDDIADYGLNEVYLELKEKK